MGGCSGREVGVSTRYLQNSWRSRWKLWEPGRSGQVRFAEWPIERSHPDRRQEANRVVLEYQPVGPSAVPAVRPFLSWPLKWEKNASFQTKTPSHPPTPSGATPTPTTPVLRSASQHPCPKGCWDLHTDHRAGCMHRQRRAFCLGAGRVPSRQVPGRGWKPPGTPKKMTNRGNKPNRAPPGQEEGRGPGRTGITV